MAPKAGEISVGAKIYKEKYKDSTLNNECPDRPVE
jgi:hypothetical protein